MNDLSRAAKDAYFARLKTFGSDAAYACRSFPSAVLAGLGLRPVRIPLSVNDTGGTPVREDICPLVDLLSGSLARSGVSLAAGMHTCDMTRRYFQESARLTETTVYQLQLPATSTDAAQEYFSSELERFCADTILNGLSEGYRPESAGKWHTDSVKGMELLHSLALSVPPVALQYFYHFFRIMSPDRATTLIRELAGSFQPYRGRFKLLLTGSPVIPGDDIAAETIEENGGFLIPVNCTGTGFYPMEKPEGWSPAAMARLHFSTQRCIRCRPNSVTYDYINRMIDLRSAHGVVVKTLTFCDLWYTEKVRMKEKLNSPVLVVDAGFKTGERERTSMRLETFIQTLGVL